MDLLPQKFWIVGTDTNVGKTLVSALFVRAFDCDYFKPIQSGSQDGMDSDFVKTYGRPKNGQIHKESYIFKAPLSPHAAAAMEKKPIYLNKIRFPKTENRLIIEAAGGLLVPLNKAHMQIDLIKESGFPVILVARNALGTINHTLLSLNELRRKEIPVHCVILNNGDASEIHVEAIEMFGKTEILLQIPTLDEISAESTSMMAAYLKYSLK